MSFWGDEPKRRESPKIIRRKVWARDKGRCQICGEKVDPMDWSLGHDKARVKGGRLTVGNTFVAHYSCNSSQGTKSLRATRRSIGVTSTEDGVRKELRGLTVAQLRYLASKKGIKVRGSVEESLLYTTRKAPPKTKFVNALAKKVTTKDVKTAKNFVPEKPKKRRRKSRGLFDW